MTQKITPQNRSQLALKKYAEQILVVKRETLFPEGAWSGLKKVDFNEYKQLVHDNKEFHSRGLMEEDPTYKQIIPYIIFTHGGKYFVMERHKKASEQRLASKLSLGIGGHMRQEDLESQGTSNESELFAWARREFHEEVSYDGTFNIEQLGVINDDSNEVGRVHIGFVFLLHGNSADISIKSELASGKLVSLDECKALKENMETWSGMVVDCLE